MAELTAVDRLWSRLWFAVDGRGVIAAFDPGRRAEGPIPSTAPAASELAPLVAALRSRPPVTAPPREDRVGRTLPRDDRARLHVPLEFDGDPGRTLMFVDRTSPELDAALASGAATMRPCVTGLALHFDSLTRSLARSVHDEKLCRLCLWPPRDEDSADHPLHRGLVVYRHLADGWAAGPYGRAAVPEEALRIEELPEELQPLASRVRFPSRDFIRLARLQPIQDGPCRFDAMDWLDEDGQLRPGDL